MKGHLRKQTQEKEVARIKNNGMGYWYRFLTNINFFQLILERKERREKTPMW